MVRLKCSNTQLIQYYIPLVVITSKYGIELYLMGGRDCSLFDLRFYKAV